SAQELTPLHVAASRGCCRCRELLLKQRGDPELPDQGEGPRVPGQGSGGDPAPGSGWALTPVSAPEPGGPRRSLSFLTEDGTDGSVSSGPLSSTRRSLLEEPELGGGCGSGEPPLRRGCPPQPPSLAIPCLAPWPPADPGGPALPPQPLASSTLLSAGDELGEGPWSPGPSPQRELGPGGSLSSPQPRHPQGSPSDVQGSPGSSPTVPLVPGDHGHPQGSPSDARGSPHAAGSPNARVLAGGSGWQDPSPLGTHQPPWPHGSFSHLPTPQLPGSPAVQPGSPAVPLSPTGCSTHCSKEHLEDEERGQAPTERHSPGTEATTSPKDTAVQNGRACPVLPRPLSDETLRRRLRALGDDPGPVTELTRRLPELAAVLRTGCVPDCAQDELALTQQFDHPNRSRHWREGLVKSSFNYLLLDPRTTQNLPLHSHRLSPAECFRTFVKAIFYVGKGTRARPYRHLAEALSQHRAGTQKVGGAWGRGDGHGGLEAVVTVPAVPQGCPKVRRILEIWASGQGVISVHCFQSTVPAEAYTREGCIVEALGLQTITNQRKGNCYGVAASWPAERRRRLGVHMLHRAMRIFLAEGERQLRPADIQGGR
ncbi:ANKL1 protein, partial [Mesembrinibis cayennensis]|nr:ANKL1 protein [Mesembrinibis cayennensis]